MWRKKVDRSLLQKSGGTVLPAWVVDDYGIRNDFTASKRGESSHVKVVFEKSNMMVGLQFRPKVAQVPSSDFGSTMT